LQGTFKDHWPNGQCTILYADGAHYEGDVVKSIRHGQGVLSELAPGSEDAQDPLRLVYTGAFDSGKRQGPGAIHVEGGTFQLSSAFLDDKPEFEANQLLLKLPKSQEEEEVKVDPKAAAKKPDPKAAA
jgi:hypothetical protein